MLDISSRALLKAQATGIMIARVTYNNLVFLINNYVNQDKFWSLKLK